MESVAAHGSKWGVSVVICCHNSRQRLPQTLGHLLAQECELDLPWEVIVVDNASTDGTAEVARSMWSCDATIPLRVAVETEPGLMNARRRGFAEARYEFVSFVDDDNWVCPTWVQSVADILSAHPDVGICGGSAEAIFEVNPPPWMADFIGQFAVGDQGDSGDVTDTRGWLWGAGFTIRKSAWQDLIARGFKTQLIGRRGAALTSGEDREICYALRLAGWRLWNDQRLCLKHFIPAERATWEHVRRLRRGAGASYIHLEPYRIALNGPVPSRKESLKSIWLLRAVVRAVRLLRFGPKLRPTWRATAEGSRVALQIEREIGRLLGVVQQRSEIGSLIHQIENAGWRRA